MSPQAGQVVPRPSSEMVLAVPAHHDFVASIRALTRSAAVLSDLALEDVQELQMAVDEAATLLLPLVDPDADRQLRVRLAVEEAGLRVTMAARCRAGAEVDQTGLAWVMLSALDPEVAVTAGGGEIAIAMHRVRAGVGL
jgi:serine/threonine-protein kinase RsbW